MDDARAVPATGLLASLQRLLATLIEILQTRVEIAVTEYEEERVRLRELLVFGFMTLFFIGFGTILLTLFIVTLFSETYRLLVLGGFATLYLAVGVAAAIVLRNQLKSRPRLLAVTMAEFSKDRERLVAH
ncbi:MAG: phage holin family protein [Gammaproteobacteria bacterium]|nr:phage holin family protein [Gammaproteobacteria bacterium]